MWACKRYYLQDKSLMCQQRLLLKNLTLKKSEFEKVTSSVCDPKVLFWCQTEICCGSLAFSSAAELRPSRYQLCFLVFNQFFTPSTVPSSSSSQELPPEAAHLGKPTRKNFKFYNFSISSQLITKEPPVNWLWILVCLDREDCSKMKTFPCRLLTGMDKWRMVSKS